MKRYCYLFFISVVSLRVFSVGFSIRLEENIKEDLQYQHLRVKLFHDYQGVSIMGDLSALNDGMYKSSHGSIYYLGYYFYMNNGGIAFDLDNIRIKAGRFVHRDIIDSPYSLFISSSNIPAVITDISYEDYVFFYTTRWIRLNERSALQYPDRGANFKVFGIHFDNIRFGFQDAVVYPDASFNAEYFLNPIPGFFIQYINISHGKPWTQTGDHNSIMGFFFDLTTPMHYFYTQVLVDDLSWNELFYPDLSHNPSKLAWSIGYRLNTVIGNFGIYHAGATKYSFEPTGYYTADGISDFLYGYSYYPDSVYYIDDKEMPILYTNNYVGYKYGENNLAFLFAYENTLYGFLIQATLETIISGSKSPANPWHELLDWTEGGAGTKMLDEEILETRIKSSLLVERQFGCINAFLDTRIGIAFNKLNLHDVPEEKRVPNNEVKIWKPSEAQIGYEFLITIGIEYSILYN